MSIKKNTTKNSMLKTRQIFVFWALKQEYQVLIKSEMSSHIGFAFHAESLYTHRSIINEMKL